MTVGVKAWEAEEDKLTSYEKYFLIMMLEMSKMLFLVVSLIHLIYSIDFVILHPFK